jgi:hypothetical protein
MPGHSPACCATRPSRRPIGSSAFSAAETEIVRQLVGHTIAEVERELICETLVRYRGNRTRAACVLDISIRCLRYKIHAYGALSSEVCPKNLPGALEPKVDTGPRQDNASRQNTNICGTIARGPITPPSGPEALASHRAGPAADRADR